MRWKNLMSLFVALTIAVPALAEEMPKPLGIPLGSSTLLSPCRFILRTCCVASYWPTEQSAEPGSVLRTERCPISAADSF